MPAASEPALLTRTSTMKRQLEFRPQFFFHHANPSPFLVPTQLFCSQYCSQLSLG
jgi:hypothetical protein